MRVFIAGASGAIGSHLARLLTSRGHEVVGTSRSLERVAKIRHTGAEPAVVDLLDGDAVRRVVLESKPEAIVHEATALTGVGNLRRFDEEFALTNRLRVEGTDNLLAAAREAGAGRFVAQSFTSWPYERSGGPVKTEDDPLDPDPPAPARETLGAIRHVEQATVEAGDGIEGLALRYGLLYGPDTSIGGGGEQLEAIRRRRFPVVGSGAGILSLVHVEDAAEATADAVERGEPGVYNIVDDEPAPVAEWLPALADAIGARPPRHVPTWLGRLVVGELGVAMMTESRGASNAKAKRELGWRLRFPSWRQGFVAGLGDSREVYATA
jgi:nucleoside-diphosphate-sugar epimerase